MKFQILACLIFTTFVTMIFAQVEVEFPSKAKEELEQIRNDDQVNLSGLWEGKISQLSWDGKPEFKGTTGKLHVEIEQTGNRITGLLVCRAKFARNQGYLSYDKYFTGIWRDGKLVYQDQRVENYINTHKDLRHLETCLKSGKLDFYHTKGLDHLEGSWMGKGHITDVECIPGHIHLTKVKEEDLIMEDATIVNVNFEQRNGKPVELLWDEDNKLKKIKSRKVDKGKTIEVASKNLSITVYDHKRNDGDIISLNYNGNWLLQKYKIDNEQHSIDLVLKSNQKFPNYVLLYAHNLGKYPPNTVAIIVDDGISQQRFILNSDMNVCDVIYFKMSEE